MSADSCQPSAAIARRSRRAGARRRWRRSFAAAFVAPIIGPDVGARWPRRQFSNPPTRVYTAPGWTCRSRATIRSRATRRTSSSTSPATTAPAWSRIPATRAYRQLRVRPDPDPRGEPWRDDDRRLGDRVHAGGNRSGDNTFNIGGTARRHPERLGIAHLRATGQLLRDDGRHPRHPARQRAGPAADARHRVHRRRHPRRGRQRVPRHHRARRVAVRGRGRTRTSTCSSRRGPRCST